MTAFIAPPTVQAASLALLLTHRGYRAAVLPGGLVVYDLGVGGARPIWTVRVAIDPAGPKVDIHSIGRRGEPLWVARFSGGTPEAVVLAAIETAEVAR